jgi:RecQ family ATP-dependent DNA helicase
MCVFHESLQHFFGFSSFRDAQEDVVRLVHEGVDDVVVLMPTGGGKSLCYQLPAAMGDGLTVVISPLRALIEDQVAALRARGIPTGVLMGGAADRNQATLAQLATYRLLYTTPETLEMNQGLRLELGRVRVDRVVIDEAHCVSSWGHDFRPSFLALRDVRRSFPDVPLLALTATAPKKVELDIIEQLGMQDPTVFRSSYFRPNLELRVELKPRSFQQALRAVVRQHRGECGLVYCATRAKTEQYAAALGVPYYHAGLDAEERSRIQREWHDGTQPVITATIAFGMGIDKPNVRFVVHTALPQSVEQYYQEIGRAGRDGQASRCYLYYSYADKVVAQQMIQKSADTKTKGFVLHQNNILLSMLKFAEDQVTCRHQMICAYFQQRLEPCGRSCDNCRDRKQETLVDVTDTCKAVCHLLMEQPFSKAQLRQRLGKQFRDIDRLLIHLVVHRYLKETVVRSCAGFWMERLHMYKKATHILDATVRIQLPFYEKPAKTARVSAKVAAKVSAAPKGQSSVAGGSDAEDALKAYRRDKAKERNCAAYMVLTNAIIDALVRERPRSLLDLRQIKGIGPKKVDAYGNDLLRLLRDT